MTPEERAVAKERSRQFRELPPERKERLKKRADEFRQLPPQEQVRVRERYKWFKDLPSEERELLRERWRSLPPDERSRIKNGIRDKQDASRGDRNRERDH
jgi:hypothetical protein